MTDKSLLVRLEKVKYAYSLYGVNTAERMDGETAQETDTSDKGTGSRGSGGGGGTIRGLRQNNKEHKEKVKRTRVRSK